MMGSFDDASSVEKWISPILSIVMWCDVRVVLVYEDQTTPNEQSNEKHTNR